MLFDLLTVFSDHHLISAIVTEHVPIDVFVRRGIIINITTIPRAYSLFIMMFFFDIPIVCNMLVLNRTWANVAKIVAVFIHMKFFCRLDIVNAPRALNKWLPMVYCVILIIAK